MLKEPLHRQLHKPQRRTERSQHCTKLPRAMWAYTYGIDHWMPAKLVDCLTAKPVDCLTAKLVDHLTTKLMNCLTAKLVDCLTTKLMVVNLVKKGIYVLVFIVQC